MQQRSTGLGWLLTSMCGLFLGVGIGCAGMPMPDGAGGLAQAAGGCPNMMDAGAVGQTDFAGQFGIDAQAAGKIRAGVLASIEMKSFADKLDADVRAACGGLARDLGAQGDYKTGQDACQAAVNAMNQLKGRLGAKAKINLAVVPPRCSASMDAMADCVGKCDVDVQPGQAEMQCEGGEISGTCEGQCSGSCDIQAGAKCEGTCKGSCAANFSGKCGGACNGKCDGKKSNGATCAGKCEGTCEAEASGSCGGECKGSCELKGSAKCEGQCRGKCSVAMKAPQCSGSMEPPKASAECKAQCQAKVQAQVECQPAHVSVVIEGGADPSAVTMLKVAFEKNLPAILRIAIGMKDQAVKVAGNVKTVVEGLNATISGMGGGAGGGAARLAACVAAPFKSAFDAAASVQANVDVSVNVQASASASASGSASGKAGG